jgi:hypothetical protein
MMSDGCIIVDLKKHRNLNKSKDIFYRFMMIYVEEFCCSPGQDKFI